MKKITVMFYSATGTSRQLAEFAGRALALGLKRAGKGALETSANLPESDRKQEMADRPASLGQGENAAYDLLRNPLQEYLQFTADEVLLLAMPVYSGRMPPPLLPSLKKLRGRNTPAIILVTYGDRAYDDALLELADRLEERGFAVIGAGAFVARHAVFPRYAVGRPDEADLAVLEVLAERCAQKLAGRRDFKAGELAVKGSRPYVQPQELPIYPSAGRRCKACGTCARLCPVKAIDPQRLKARPAKRCLACAACIRACPQQARKFRGLLYNGLDLLFVALSFFKKSPRKEPEIFV